MPKNKTARPLYPGWANGRDDLADYHRLASALGPRLRPVRPAGRQPDHFPGQLPLWAGSDEWVKRPRAPKHSESGAAS